MVEIHHFLSVDVLLREIFLKEVTIPKGGGKSLANIDKASALLHKISPS
jgi:hypothetical protein